MAFRSALAASIVVGCEAEIGERAVGKDIGGQARRDRHGDRRLLDQCRGDEDERA